ncbi:MAG: pitrilysin family protein [Pseudomonadota bacterium]
MIRFLAVFFILVASPLKAAVEIQEVTSPGGFRAWLVEEHSIPFAAIEIRFKGGASLDDPDTRGAIHLMTGLLEEGAADKDARAFAQARDDLATSIGFDIYDDSLSISLKFLSENRHESVALLRDALNAPRFDPSAVERVRSQVLSILRSDAEDPNEIASATFDELAFGTHPYGSSLEGTLASVEALTRDDLIDAKNRILAQDRVFVGASGDITPEELASVMDMLFSDLPLTGAAMPSRVEVGLKGGVTVVDYDTPQSVALFGHSGIKQEDPEFFAAFLLNTILGASGFEARLMTELREKRGLTYGIYSYLAPKDYAELYVGQFSTSNDRMAEAIEVARAEWTRMSEEGVTEAELARAKTYLTGAYPLRFDGNGPIANIMVGMQMQGLPIDYIPTRNDRVTAVTLEEVNDLASRLLRPEDLHFVVVGRPEGLASSN